MLLISKSKIGRVSIVNKGKSKTITEVFSIGLVIVFILVMGFRGNTVGIDTFTYNRIYGSIAAANSFSDAVRYTTFTGPIYILLCRGLTLITNNPQILTFITSVIVNVGLYIFLKNTSEDVACSLYLWIGIGIFYFSMNGNRQTIAMVLNLNALYLLYENRKDIRGWILLGIAIGIHPTSIIMLLFGGGIYLSEKIKNTKVLYLVSAMTAVSVKILFKQVFNLLIKIFPNYVKYTTSMEGRATIFENSGGGRIIIVYIALLILITFWCFQNQIKKDSLSEKMFPTIVFALFFGILNSKNVYISRMLLYFLSGYTIVFPTLLNKIQRKLNKFLILGCMSVLLLMYNFMMLIENQNGIVPYQIFR